MPKKSPESTKLGFCSFSLLKSRQRWNVINPGQLAEVFQKRRKKMSESTLDTLRSCQGLDLRCGIRFFFWTYMSATRNYRECFFKYFRILQTKRMKNFWARGEIVHYMCTRKFEPRHVLNNKEIFKCANAINARLPTLIMVIEYCLLWLLDCIALKREKCFL